MSIVQGNTELCGFLNILKPPGMTSAQVVAYTRRMLGGEKAGHAGTLDPEAAGVLPLMIGKATRLFDYMQDKEKAYITEIAFGTATDTQDAQGTAVASGDMYPDEETLQATLPRFTGEILQAPSLYSAIKQDGHRLYQLARSGHEVDIPARAVTVYELRLLSLTERHGAMLYVRCSKGFYVRALCDDIGRALGCPAHMRFLLRVQSGAFTLREAVTLEALSEAAARGDAHTLLLPPETALLHLPACDVTEKVYRPLRNGVPVPFDAFLTLHGTCAEQGAPFRVSFRGVLTAIAQRDETGSVKVRTWLKTDIG